MSVLEAIDAAGIHATVVQPVYLEPFPVWELEEYREKSGIVIEMNSTGQLAMVLHDKIGFHPQALIQKYDGRPFTPLELAQQINEVR